MVYLAGDIHGDIYRVIYLIEKLSITSDDIIVLLGDVGLNYSGNDKGDKEKKKILTNINGL